MKKSTVRIVGTPPEERDENMLKKIEQEKKLVEELAVML